IVYAGTGDPDVPFTVFVGDGIYKSTDGGNTWTNIGLASTKIINKIKAWALKNNVDDTAKIDDFYRTFIMYPGTNADFNKTLLPLLQHGIRYLASFAEALNDDKIPLERRRTILGNLFSSLAVCAPGVYTNIREAHLKLSTDSIAVARREIVVQETLALLRKEDPDLLGIGMEIHYVNAVLEDYTTQIGLPTIEDEYIDACERTVVNSVKEQFDKAVIKCLTVERVFDSIIANFNLYQIKTNTDFDDLDNELRVLGEDDLYSRANLMDENATSFELRETAIYEIIISVAKRLAKSFDFKGEYIPIEGREQNLSLFLAENSGSENISNLKFSYFQFKNEDGIQRKSFISYCTDLLLGNERDIHFFTNGILARLNDQQKKQLCAEILSIFTQRTIHQQIKSDDVWIQQLFNLLTADNKLLKQFFHDHAVAKDLYALSRQLPEGRKTQIILALDRAHTSVSDFPEYFALCVPAKKIINLEKIANFILVHPETASQAGKCCNDIFNQLTVEAKQQTNQHALDVWTDSYFFKLFQTPATVAFIRRGDIDSFIQLAKELPVDKRPAFLKLANIEISHMWGAKYVDTFLDILDLYKPSDQLLQLAELGKRTPHLVTMFATGNHLGRLLHHVPAKETADFLKQYFGSDLLKIITHKEDLYSILRQLNREQYQSFLKYLHTDVDQSLLMKLSPSLYTKVILPLISPENKAEIPKIDQLSPNYNSLIQPVDDLASLHTQCVYNNIACQNNIVYFNLGGRTLTALNLNDISHPTKRRLTKAIMQVLPLQDKNKFAVILRGSDGNHEIMHYDKDLNPLDAALKLPGTQTTYRLLQQGDGSYMVYDREKLFHYNSKTNKWDEKAIKKVIDDNPITCISLLPDQRFLITLDEGYGYYRTKRSVCDANFKVLKNDIQTSYTDLSASPNGKCWAYLLPQDSSAYLGTPHQLEIYHVPDPLSKQHLMSASINAFIPKGYMGKALQWEADGNLIFLSQKPEEGVMRFNTTDFSCQCIYQCDAHSVSSLTVMPDGQLFFISDTQLITLAPSTKQLQLQEAKEHDPEFLGLPDDIRINAKTLFLDAKKDLDALIFDLTTYTNLQKTKEFSKNDFKSERQVAADLITLKNQQIMFLADLDHSLANRKDGQTLVDCLMKTYKSFSDILQNKTTSSMFFKSQVSSNPYRKLYDDIIMLDLPNPVLAQAPSLSNPAKK
ncbi:MAG: hypothetical protein ABI597_11270, partial [Gammaproteobacteria bacterium]